MAVLTSKKILEYKFEDLEIHVYTETQIKSNMYAIFSGNSGLIIDPIANTQVLDMFHNRKVEILKLFLTHEHFDHISGVNYYKERFPCEVICSALCAEALPDPKKNLSRYYNLVLQAHLGESAINQDRYAASFSSEADTIYENNYEFALDNHVITAMAVGGHSLGSSIINIDNEMLFTGDNLIPGENTIVTLPGGSENQYELLVKPFILSLSNKCHIFPGHGAPGILKQILLDHPDYAKN